jgi:hypothetical protein
MRHVFATAALVLLLASPAAAGQIGNFSTEASKDPITDAPTLIAMTSQNNQFFTIRCLAGDQSLMLGLTQDAQKGDSVAVILRIDQSPPQDLETEVMVSKGGMIAFQLGDAALIGQLSGARQVALRTMVADVVKTSIFQLRDSAKVVAAVQEACKPK